MQIQKNKIILFRCRIALFFKKNLFNVAPEEGNIVTFVSSHGCELKKVVSKSEKWRFPLERTTDCARLTANSTSDPIPCSNYLTYQSSSYKEAVTIFIVHDSNHIIQIHYKDGRGISLLLWTYNKLLNKIVFYAVYIVYCCKNNIFSHVIYSKTNQCMQIIGIVHEITLSLEYIDKKINSTM